MISVEIQVFGKVQGVFFRASAKQKADSLGITGWVKNLSDGSVLMHLQGNERAVEEMEEWCKQGPQFARVDGIEVSETTINNLLGFQIIH